MAGSERLPDALEDHTLKVLLRPHQAELIIQKSRFIALVEPITEAPQARELLKTHKEAHPGAAHVVHAFQVGLDRSLTGGCSDDGEPPGTAGRPTYDVLKGFGCSNVLLTIIRYFGGIKLGTGGLVKAYGDAAKLVLAEAEWEDYRPTVNFTVLLEYPEHRPFIHLIEEMEGRVENEQFAENVVCVVNLPVNQSQTFEKRVEDLTKGRVKLSKSEPV